MSWSRAKHIQKQGQTLHLSSQMINQSKVHLLGEPLIAIITSGRAFSALMIYCLIQRLLHQPNVENKSI